MTAKKGYEKIEKMDYPELLGFVISESVNEMDNSYENMGYGLDRVIANNPDQIDLIEKVIIALTGWNFETLAEKMKDNKDYYNSL